MYEFLQDEERLTDEEIVDLSEEARLWEERSLEERN